MKIVSVLGSTGSIGKSVLDVIRLNKKQFKIFALSCKDNVDLLVRQAIEFSPKFIVCTNEINKEQIITKLPKASRVKVLYSNDANKFIVSHKSVTHVIAAISGSAGLESTYEAAISGKEILLANKESMVMAGPLIMNKIKTGKSNIIPIDSEHNALYQIFKTLNPNIKNLKRIILTASGGPFLNYKLKDFKQITLKQALKHPNWKMGKKITIDSATMMNKALEVIEASYLFNIPSNKIDILIHPQSIIHSLVEYHDGSLLSHFGNPDMKIPISYALGHPNRILSGDTGIDLTKKELIFRNVDPRKFPCLSLAYFALNNGHSFCVALNAVNEESVKAFIDKKIKFKDIYKVNLKILEGAKKCNLSSINEIMYYDLAIREIARKFITKIS
jgi:1-deoxy-D-xylulose-5-phosphate reductoisomerase